ncbi:MAG: acyl-homoserine-lactone acylase [Solirubrobacterales bacterium]|jgi:acyl-homoserine-lactone acylase|nr:acyl-homoserine-lactone acylase [Solirubrobacterales bacterium]
MTSPFRSPAVVVALLACLIAAPVAEAAKKGGLEATITRQKQGIPTIEADNFKSLGFGYGYALAQDEICTMADTYLTSEARRSQFFGPDAKSPENFTNLDSDLFYQQAIDNHVVEDLVATKGKQALDPDLKQGVKGYVKGYNAWLAKNQSKIKDPACAGQPWVQPITVMDAYRRFYELTLYASSGVAIDGITEAQPPAASPRPTRAAGDAAPTATPEQAQKLAEALDFSDTGSNGWAIGKDMTKNGEGITLANPHFPWDGPRRFYQSHLVIPGELNVSGASLLGSPIINIGHTAGLAWTHTVSTAFRFVPFQLTLAPGDPTSYVVDGQTFPMDHQTVTVQVKQPDGSLQPVSRTLYSTRYGPVFNRVSGQSIFAWTNANAYALFDANAQTLPRLLNHFFATNQAESTKDLLKILKQYQGIPWVNTIASDSKGKALYADIGAVPNVPDSKVVQCNSSLGQITLPAAGLAVLDGSRAECALTTDPDARGDGLMGVSKMPVLQRKDYVENGNDSYWLTNPAQPLEGFPRIIGAERTQRSLRTRLGIQMLEGAGDNLTRKSVQDLVFQDRQYLGELWRDQLVAYCNAHPTMTGSSGPVDVSAACAALAGWDLHVNLDSTGALLFERFVDRYGTSAARFSTPFDVNNPVNTPSGLDTSATNAPILETAFANAVTDLQGANIPLSGPYGDFHYEVRNGDHIPIHGGEGGQGAFNAIADTWDPATGYSDIVHGSSFVMVTQFDGDECPNDRSILTYSLSDDETSKYYADQTKMFSGKQWVDPPFCPKEVSKTAASVKTVREK